jgi:hypothetical protein
MGFYGPFPHEHVELVVEDGGVAFVGHGSAAVDGATPGLPTHYRSYV